MQSTAFLLAPAPPARTIAILLGAVTAVVGATICFVRPETKRRLGWSTVAQMGFMVLQCGCGAFAAAIVHLVAHGGYKSAAFLGAAGCIDEHKFANRQGSVPQSRLAAPLLALFALAPSTLGVAIAWTVLHDRLLDLPAASLVIALAWLTATSAARRCAECSLEGLERAVSLGFIVVAVPTYLITVTALDAWLGAALPRVPAASPALAVACVAFAAGLLEGFGLRPRMPDAVYTLALVEGNAVPFEIAI